MSESRFAESIGFLRSAEGDNPLAFEGLIPYGQVSRMPVREYGKKEAFAPGAFRPVVERWMSRTDGGRMPFLTAHDGPDVGSVTMLRDADDGLHFHVEFDDDADGQKAARKVRAGRNGISPKFWPNEERTSLRGPVVVHHEVQDIFNIAGSVTPAYDGARLNARDMEEPTVAEDPKQPEPAPEPPAPQPQGMDRAEPPAGRTSEQKAMERDAVAKLVDSSGILITRPELVYRPNKMAGGEFLRDAYLASRGDTPAVERQYRHAQHMSDLSREFERAGDLLQSEIPGALPTDFLPGLLTPRILKGRPMGSFFDRFPISDTRPKTFAKVTTSTAVVVQSAEGAALGATDLATTAVTATPVMYGGYIDVSRQVLDSADPSALSMVMQDLVEAYAQASETVIKTAVEAGASASGTAITAATPFAGTLGNVIKYYTTRFKAAEAQFIPAALFAVLLAEADTTGRPKMPLLNPMNSDGTTQPGGISGSVLGSTTFLSYASTVNVVVTARSNDYVIYESSLASFSFDQVVGPQAVRIGCWAYLVVGTRLGGLSVTAA